MDQFINDIINKKYTAAEKQFQLQMTEMVADKISTIKETIAESLLESTQPKQNFKVYYSTPEGKEHTSVIKANSHSHAKKLIHKFAGSDVKITDSKQLNESEMLEEAKKLPMEEMKDENENGVCDDEEQLDEISKKTLGSYVKRANVDRGNVRQHVGWVGGDESTRRIIKNRTKGISKALDKISADKAAKDDIKKDVTTYGKHRHYSGKLAGFDGMSNGYSRQATDQEARDVAHRVYKAVDKLTEDIDTLNEDTQSHKVSVTVSEPDHPMVSKRKESIEKRVIVSAGDKSEARAKAESFYKKKGYKVHDSNYISVVPRTSNKTE